jgi:hypothetical protein
MLFNSVVDGLKGPLLILVVARCWRPNMSAGGYCEAAQGHLRKKGRLERGSKMVGSTNRLARHVVGERLEGGKICAHLYPSLFSLFFPQAQLAASQCAPAGVPTSPHLTTTNLAPAM